LIHSRINAKLFFKSGKYLPAALQKSYLSANPRNVSTNRKRAIALPCPKQSFVNSKAFGVKRLGTYEFKSK
jgi:hypothetical protein